MGSPTSNPKTTVSLTPANIVDAFADRRDVIFGQVPTTATKASLAGLRTSNVHAETTADIKTMFGSTSYLTNQILAWKASNESYSPLDVVSITELTTGDQAIFYITPTGTSTAAATINISVFDEKLYNADVVIPSGSNVAAITALIETALLALTDEPFVASDDTTHVSITATDYGTIGNSYGIRIEGTVPGVTFAITLNTPGTVDPVITSVLAPITGTRYTGVVWPDNWALTTGPDIDAEMDSRFNASNAVMDGVVFHGIADLYNNLLADPADTNSPSICLVANEFLDNTGLSYGPTVNRVPGLVAAEFAGIRARRLTPSAPITNFLITTSGGLDAFGGPSLASLPYFNTPLANTPVTPAEYLWTSVEQAGLETAGVSSYGVNSAENAMIMQPVVTTWTTDAGGNDNVSFKYLNYVDTGSACREIFYSTLKSTFAQTRLTEGNLIAGRSMANEESIKAELLKIYRVLSDLALTQAGSDAENYFSTNTTVTVSLADRSVTITGPLPIVTQLGTINYTLQMAFTITGTGTQITV